MRNDLHGLILVTGGRGQLATSLAKLGGVRVVVVGRPEFDFDRPETIAVIVEKYRPSFVVNAAAWTAVDLAESEVEGAVRANETGPAELAHVCAEYDVPLIHISTDYVYAGDKGEPYVETDLINPQTVYGLTKAAGEQAVLALHSKSLVLRTAWVYSAYGKNFVRSIINASSKKAQLNVVNDQSGNPTSSDDLAIAILAIIKKLQQGWEDAYAGIYHATGSGTTTWYGLAIAVLKAAEKAGHPMPEVLPILTEDWPTPARRPKNSCLDGKKIQKIFNIQFPPWQESVKRTIKDILG
ncbi:dTDP-4-dehydrorhamnose reductase [Novacetimonas pomaceti]|uniref:dTDP-4-dehydrorhamnose reductase n=1 Tax=Novacetimonas pomaceti TaxID=2021998 RepID=UPI001C2D5792|nr:dTDP-4-dehydrorhamnose reductase [Novacetimonas pomaceti]MBV1835303.1 dTDP-4-dehydrorhamnose reductase [Novacetimonas pomaceti]